MKAFVTGVGGQLGYDVVNELFRRGYGATGSDVQPEYSGIEDGTPASRVPYVSLDITDGKRVREILLGEKPDVVIHCAAWTAVDAAEDPENRDIVRKVNVDGTRNIAEACRALGCKMVYLSTDYVFDGQGTVPWQADSTEYLPLNVYGQTKLEGEQAVRELVKKHFIVRVAWVFGKNGKNFVRTMLKLSVTHRELRVVSDQIGTPTYTPDLARLLVDMAETEKYGTYHATNEGGFISWAEFAEEIFRQAGKDTHVIPVLTSEYGLSKAARPFNSRLDKSKLTKMGFAPLPDWRDALSCYLRETGA